ncbi:hypothetical protein ACHAXR_002674 [Thalassiosira sp. AJA248-18]
MTSQQSASSRPIYLRMVALACISFFTGLQFKHMKDLFGSSVDGVNIDAAAWAPEDFDRPARSKTLATKELSRREKRGRDKSENRQPERGIKEMASGNKKNKKKKYKPPRRFEASNYTNDFKPLPWTLPKPTPMRYQTAEEFMVDYIAAKHKQKIPLPWDQQDKYAGKIATLPLPIISLNFPKSATLTMKTYFDCGGLTSAHTSTNDGRIGVCMMENHFNDKPPMDGCNTHKLRHDSHDVVPIDFISDIGLQGPPCYYSSLHDGGLEHIAKFYPDATILLVTRNASSWHRSMSNWGSIFHRWRKYCGFDASLHDGKNMEYWKNMFQSNSVRSKEEYWVNFYQAHTQKIREFAMKHLSMTYVEVELADNMGELLEKYTKVSASCVMDCHPGPKWVKEHNATGRCHPVGENPALKDATLEANGEEGGGDGEEEGSDNDDDGKTDDDADNKESDE